MVEYEIRQITDKIIWENFVLSKHPRSFLHSWNWGETQASVGKKISRFGIYKRNKLVGVCLCILEPAKRGRHLIVPGGPLIDWSDRQMLSATINELKRIAKHERCWFVRTRPEVLESDENLKLFQSLGFIRSPMHLHAQNTWVVDLHKDQDEILATMKKNTRYEVRKSLNNGLVVRKSTDRNDSKILFNLQEETIRRNKFVGFSNKFFASQIENFGKDNQAYLYLISKDDTVLVAAIIIFYGDYAYYHHSGSSDEARDLNASYFLQWNVILDAKKRGFKSYDMWGAVPKGSKNHRFSGPSLFKKGFGGTQVDWIPAHDLPVSKLYWSTYLFEKTRKTLRRL